MAAVARRTWYDFEAEVIHRLGNIDALGFTLRVDQWIWQAYQWLALTYHHYELEAKDLTQKIPTDDLFLVLPDDCFLVFAVLRKDTAGRPLGAGLSLYDSGQLIREFRGEVGMPARYGRYADSLVFDKIGDQPYPLGIYYYKMPDRPDFTASGTAGSALGPDLDMTIIDLALALGFPAVGRPDLGEAAAGSASTYLSMQPRPPLLNPLAARERPNVNRVAGGAQV